MDTRWHCPVCGCTGRHYSESRMAIVCDQCGHSTDDTMSDEDRRNFDRAVAFAKDHLRVGNWQECKNLISPFCYRNPNNAKLYLILLAAQTKGYTDYLLDDENGRKAARDYWDKLERLRKVNTVMRNYAREANAHKKARMMRKRWGLIAIIAITLGAAALFTSLDSFFLTVVSFMVGAAFLCDNIQKNKKAWTDPIPTGTGNPFLD